VDTTWLETHIFHKVLEKNKSSSKIIVTFQVMAVAGMSPGHPYPIGPFPQSGQNQHGAYPAGARNSDNADIRRILQSSDTGEISSTVTTPVT
jgi:hypothetical protein